MTDIPGGWLSLAIFLVVQIAAAIIAVTKLQSRVDALERRQSGTEDALKAFGRFDSRLIKIEVLLDQILHKETLTR
jgi:hypothetical protein